MEQKTMRRKGRHWERRLERQKKGQSIRKNRKRKSVRSTEKAWEIPKKLEKEGKSMRRKERAREGRKEYKKEGKS